MSHVPDVPEPAPDVPRPTPDPSPVRPAEATPHLPEVQGPADLRCSDVDRERVAEALRNAAGDGRLTLSELEDRLDATFKARTYGDLQPITRDLPQGPYPMPGGNLAPRWKNQKGAPAAGQASGHAAPATGGPIRPQERITSILGSDKRTGRWEVPARIDVLVILGKVVLDFTEAIVRTREIEIQAGVVMGSLTLIVPEGIDVRMEQGGNVLGKREMKLRADVTPGSPVYHVRGFVVHGEITVRPPKPPRRSLLG